MSVVIEVKKENQEWPKARRELLLSTHGAYFGFTAYHPDEGFNPCRVTDPKSVDEESWDATIEKYKGQNMVMCFSDTLMPDDKQQPIVLFGSDEDASVVAYITQHEVSDVIEDTVGPDLQELWETVGSDVSKFIEALKKPRQSNRLLAAIGKGALVLHTKTGEVLMFYDSPTCHVYAHGFTSNHFGWELPEAKKPVPPAPEPKKAVALGGKPNAAKPVLTVPAVPAVPAVAVKTVLQTTTSPTAIDTATAGEEWAKPPTNILSSDERALRGWYKQYEYDHGLPDNFRDRPAIRVRKFLPDKMDRAAKPAPIASVTPIKQTTADTPTVYPARYLVLGELGTKTLADWDKAINPNMVIPNPATLVEREGKLPTLSKQYKNLTLDRQILIPLIEWAKMPPSILLSALNEVRQEYARKLHELSELTTQLESFNKTATVRKAM